MIKHLWASPMQSRAWCAPVDLTAVQLVQRAAIFFCFIKCCAFPIKGDNVRKVCTWKKWVFSPERNGTQVNLDSHSLKLVGIREFGVVVITATVPLRRFRVDNNVCHDVYCQVNVSTVMTMHPEVLMCFNKRGPNNGEMPISCWSMVAVWDSLCWIHKGERC